jgi:uncharacterized membrane protein (UPF0127 family)
MSFRKLPLVSLVMDGRTMPLRIYEANGFLARAQGLLGGAPLASNEALWIRPCNSVHTLGMRYAIDVVFLDRWQRVIAVRQALKPLRLAGVRRAHSTVELKAGTAAALGVSIGSRLERVAA